MRSPSELARRRIMNTTSNARDELRIEPCVDAHLQRLSDWLVQQAWPHHARVRVDAQWVRERAAEGYFTGVDVRSFWVEDRATLPLGLIRVFDLGDVTPLIDLRIGEAARGRGVGTFALRWLTRFVFDTFPETHRLGGYTRFDNVAMCRVFRKCGYVEEARHRQAWRVEGGGFVDTLGYAILRSEWSTLDPAGTDRS